MRKAQRRCWSLLRLPQRKARAVNAPHWKVWWGVFWPIAPALLLVGLPRLLLLQTGRYFDLGMLLRVMPELVVLLGICGVMGLVNSLVRVVAMAGPRALRSSAS